MVQKINPAELVLRTEVRALDEINKAASMYSREHAEVMEAAKLVEQRRQNDLLERIARALESITPGP
jgi:hypothetical protein